MCGIVGMVSRYSNGLYKQTEDSFYEMLFADTLRGDDSTGVIAVEKDTTFHIAKEASAATWFIPEFEKSSVAKKMFNNGRAYIGHNRKKTVGSLSDENAHPFVVNNEFAMVHNGTLYHHKDLADTTVDSEALAIVLAEAFKEKDYTEALEKTLGRVDGAYAVAMYDQRHNCVRILRNKERPLAYVQTGNAWFFASEAAMLGWILLRNGYSPQDLKIQIVPEHTVITFDLDKNEMKEEKITPKKPLTPVHSVATGVMKTIMKGHTNPKLSKQAFKKLRRTLLNKYVQFWAEDFIETNFPKTESDGETLMTLMGVCDEIDEDNHISAIIDLNEYNFTSKEITDRLWVGKVQQMDYEPKIGKIFFRVKGAYPAPISKPKTIDAEYIKRKLDEKEKTKLTVH
jgi:predicted glutamine amidotransferase